MAHLSLAHMVIILELALSSLWAALQRVVGLVFCFPHETKLLGSQCVFSRNALQALLRFVCMRLCGPFLRSLISIHPPLLQGPPLSHQRGQTFNHKHHGTVVAARGQMLHCSGSV